MVQDNLVLESPVLFEKKLKKFFSNEFIIVSLPLKTEKGN